MASAVLFERHPFERIVLCRLVAKVLSMGLVTGMKDSGADYPAGILVVPAYGETIRDRGAGSTKCGQAVVHDEPRIRVSSWPPLRLARLRREREFVVVVSPHAPVLCNEGDGSRGV